MVDFFARLCIRTPVRVTQSYGPMMLDFEQSMCCAFVPAVLSVVWRAIHPCQPFVVVDEPAEVYRVVPHPDMKPPRADLRQDRTRGGPLGYLAIVVRVHAFAHVPLLVDGMLP
jgi:hypothetical protein